MSKDGTRIGSLKQVVELRARIAELESELRISDEKLDDQTGLLLGERESRKKAEAELAAERERRAADETDAARYRWLREWRARWEIRYWNGIYWSPLTTDELDAASDAAIRAEAK